MKSDIEIAQEVQLKPIQEIASNLGISAEALEPYGRFKAKIRFEPNEAAFKQGNLILVTAKQEWFGKNNHFGSLGSRTK
jgi:formate--tetrahydrofolate ligase